ncbi:hypothetical protein Nepgr_007252 [Nepenthes gracilis]|uniref:Uncharacterized protein n=1 Tax=Nepenthes gracilis TaxID=150966 RepID=A0AAD3XI39_NEPGR|nr:hypothetical protein Nepgr_007252 [Nepenthes gracilis]
MRAKLLLVAMDFSECKFFHAKVSFIAWKSYYCISRFCDVKTSRTPPLPDLDESTKVAEGIASWGLDYNVITSVDRDDLPDQGSVHFAETVQKFKALKLNMLTEAIGTTFIHA